ncbi:MAG: PA14 domain-containing protein, partial [Planctomycetota bacterium]|nr:PA14 domain-containing protein [Planctomycetota bacterium]
MEHETVNPEPTPRMLQRSAALRAAPREQPLEVPAPVARALTRFAEITSRLTLWEAAGWALAAAAVLFTLIALTDRCLLVGDGVRRSAALVAYVLSLSAAVPFLYRAFRRRTAPEVARLLEGRGASAQLQERVSTTVELASHTPSGEGVSMQMIGRVADEAAQLIETLDVEQLPDRAGARRAGKTAAAAFGVIVLLCLVPGVHMASFYLRAFVPWGRLHRPSDTTLAVLPGDTRVVEGALLEIEAQAGGVPVREAWVETREQGGSAWTRLLMDPDAEQTQRFTAKVGPMRARLAYRVRAGDCLTPEFQAAVLPRPEIAGLTVVARYPAYTGLAAETFERINGDLSILKGTRVEMALRANTGLSAAVLDFASGRKLSMAVNGAGASGSFDISEDTQYRVLLRSQEGVENPDAPLFSIHAIPDRPPQVAVLKPQVDQTVGAALLLNLEARAEDDLGLVACRLVVRTDMRPNATVIRLQRPPDSGKVWLLAQPWDLAGLFLQDGETVLYHVEAVDTAGAVGRSDERRLRVAAGRKSEAAQVLSALEKAQAAVGTARRLMNGARKDIADMRQVFRPQDTEFQSAERLLLAETFRRVSNEAQAAADALAPTAAEKLTALHQALTAGHRYTGATLLAEHAADVRDAQAPITPVLVGAAAWSPKEAYTPGLLAEYYRGTSFNQLVRRTVEDKIELKNADLPDVGRENFSVCWTGQVLAPNVGRYVFGMTVNDGARLAVDGKKIIDAWRTQATAWYEGAIELTEGWHDIRIEFFQAGGDYEISLVRTGPQIPRARIPPEHLRNVGMPVAVADGNVQQAMAKGASEAALKQAMLRLQTMLRVARGLSPELSRLAGLPPDKDQEGLKDAGEWGKDVTRQTAELVDVGVLSPPLALPLAQWRDHTRTVAERYESARRRYRAAVELWVQKLAAEVFEESAKLRELQQTAEAAKKAFDALAEAARQPKDEKRAAAMARAETTVRALAEDLGKQADEVAADFKHAAEDMHRPLEERRLLQALEHRAEEMAAGPAADLEKRLAEAKTAEELARTQEKVPNFGTQAAELARQAGELAQSTEKMERAVALREALKDAANDADAAREAL